MAGLFRRMVMPVPPAHPAPDTRPAQRLWLDVPFSENDQARRLGARWDAVARRWYVPGPAMEGLARWAPLPDLLPGEYRTFGSGLFVDLIPETSWFRNIRTAVAPRDWERIRKMVYRRADYRCEACGRQVGRGTGLRAEAHERFVHDDAQHVQSLRRLLCLCDACHQATHFGHACAIGDDEKALAQLQTVTGMSQAEAIQQVDAAFTLWEQRSQVDWILDLSVVTNAGIAMRLPELPRVDAPDPAWRPVFDDPPDQEGTSITIREQF